MRELQFVFRSAHAHDFGARDANILFIHRRGVPRIASSLHATTLLDVRVRYLLHRLGYDRFSGTVLLLELLNLGALNGLVGILFATAHLMQVLGHELVIPLCQLDSISLLFLELEIQESLALESTVRLTFELIHVSRESIQLRN